MSEIFWEGLHRFYEAHHKLLKESLNSNFVARGAATYTRVIRAKFGALQNCISLTDGTVIGIACPGYSAEQNAAYNGHKHKNALKLQTIAAPHGLLLHADGIVEG